MVKCNNKIFSLISLLDDAMH